MPALNPHDPFRRAARPRDCASSGPCGSPERLRWLIRRIADDDRGAFAELFDRCSGLVLSDLRGQVSDRHRVAGVFAGTFVEVWWLAGCHIEPDTDVMAWIDEIVQRRVVDSRPAALQSADPDSSGFGSLDALWGQRAEVELAGLFRRRPVVSR
ncbi:hypothetical protein EV385_2998 [Krasilnikovia cinnamomea]|uniref:RNA polymerase sigma-70 factor (ECF subfamily) n=1 Tax=Krasilnikovia cinnamomea TaxID=349313 RepID=A0A4Q7ZLF8_9ACTN|nr:hypothetical protein [Krasilnikovia cinnamomea]RZU51193.1 hypothetical protein EV385_2998 [Krasilnikovia cinnamomea]